MDDPIRILFVADSHLGFDLPASPRVRRRRRGHDFLANYGKALAPALDGRVDLVVHGGDVFHRSKVPVSVAHAAYEPLRRIADRGIPVFVVPGNHERSRLPHARLARHARIYVFDRARTFVHAVRGVRVALAGFPFERRDIRSRFGEVLGRTGWRDVAAEVRLLVVHQCVEGATVGPSDFTFSTARDVIRGRDLPSGFAAVLSGHIHRHQVLTHDLRQRPNAVPVLYPGSIERTAFAEMGERKGYMTVDLSGDGEARWAFHELPARPMVVRELRAAGVGAASLERSLRALFASVPADAVLRVRLQGTLTGEVRQVLTARRVRALAPPTMNVDLRPADGGWWPPPTPTRSNRAVALELPLS